MINLKMKLITLGLAIQKGHLKATGNNVLKILVPHAAKVKKENGVESFREEIQSRTDNAPYSRAQVHAMGPIFSDQEK